MGYASAILEPFLVLRLELSEFYVHVNVIESSGADPGGGPRGPGPLLTLGFEAPKLSISGPYLIFP